ncbi:MAG: hypothetical protein QOF59_2817, partial [Actinomycetota bacterium]|nr:hypothetical protein [Actinomycetota bacterium]
MAIRFGWTRPQARPKPSDDEAVEEVASAPPEHDAQPAPDAMGHAGTPVDVANENAEADSLETHTTPEELSGAGISEAHASAAPTSDAPTSHDASERAADTDDASLTGDAPLTDDTPTDDTPTDETSTDDTPADDASTAVTEDPPTSDTGTDDTSTAVAASDHISEPGTVTPPSPETIEAIWSIHERVLEAERRTHRIIGAAAARRVHQQTLLEEVDALHALGFDRFAEFAAVYGVALAPGEPAPAAADDEPETAGETIGRIRVLLSELGIEPGVDPLQAAKEFLDVVESPDTAPTEPELSEASAAEPTPAGANGDEWVTAPVAEVPVAERQVAEIPVAETPGAVPDAAAASVESSAGLAFDEQGLELALARAERWHGELEQVRIELQAATEANQVAEHDGDEARRELSRLRGDLELAREAARVFEAEIAQRTSERDDAGARCSDLETQLAQLRE